MSTQKVNQLYQITIHCSATIEGKDYDVNDVDSWHKARGFSKQPYSGKYCGYHFIVLRDGTIQRGRYLNEVGAHSVPNTGKIGVCYIGGLDADKDACDTRTEAQKESLDRLCWALTQCMPSITEIVGHRDNSEDLNEDGIITPNEWEKSCPCFDAIPEYKYLL